MIFILESLQRKIITFIIEPFNRNSNSELSITTAIIFISTAFFFIKYKGFVMSNLSHIGDMTKKYNPTSGLRRWMPRGSQMDQRTLNKGGYIAGLVNDGNTCFMNSVIQSLASSAELMKFLDDEIAKKDKLESKEVEQEDEDASPSETGTTDRKVKGKTYGKAKKHANRKLANGKADEEQVPDVTFSLALRETLEKLNAKYYKDRPCFKTNKLLRSMSKAPNKNIILGYDQEDAQEFFQTILSELEKNVKSLEGKQSDRSPVPSDELPADAVVGEAHLDRVGDVYLPSDQIDPNLSLNDNGEQYYTPFKLITPFDGITAERIGCLQCGENGGIRYSVSSSLSLNLPAEDIGSTLKLSDLLNQWIKPEIIEGVACNRCALEAVREHLLEQLKQYESKGDSIPEKLLEAFKARVEELNDILSKPMVSDEDYKRLHTENMVRKCSKSKQILFLRPPPLLSIHINRSVFDPRTYMIRKNNSRVVFKSRLNLSPWCCDVDEINLDARLPMSKKKEQVQESSEDEVLGGEYYAKLHQTYEKEFEDSDEEEGEHDGDHYVNRDVSDYDPLNGEIDRASAYSDDADADHSSEEFLEETDALGNTITKRIAKVESDSEDENGVDVEVKEHSTENLSSLESEDEQEDVIIPPPVKSAPIPSTVPAGPLTYVLRSVIVHYGTHNYGHYIAFRKYRGCWWRISDETVYVVEEAEVLSTSGVFMLFYEYDYDEATGQMRDDLETDSDEEEEFERDGNSEMSADEIN